MEPDLFNPGSSSVKLCGMVVSVQANYYWVKLDSVVDASLPRDSLLCTRRARLKKMGQRVMVGDRVRVEEPDWEGNRGAITAIEPRQSLLDRPPVANANQILLVFALAEPELDPHQLTRFLIKAELTGLDICLCLNKRDLLDADAQTAWRDRLMSWGYSPIMTSVQYDEDLSDVQQALRNRITVVSGPSGVGKSSLINQLVPNVHLRVDTVSGKLGRGRHTTRHVELFELASGGLLADTPGFNQPDICCSPAALGTCFPEIRRFVERSECQFSDCLHRGEPGCAVPSSWERYEAYLELLATSQEQTQTTNDAPAPEAAFKIKVSGDGQMQQEPLLQAKKYRRSSRRSRRQMLQDLRYELTNNTSNTEAFEEEDLDR